MYRHVLRSRVVRTVLLAGVWMGVSSGVQADWPTYRGDAHRSGVCEEELQLPLVQSWAHAPSLPPRPAWPEMPAKRDVYRKIHGLSPTTIFDRAFHPVIEGGSLYYGSSADDKVYCVDAASGRIKWTFATEGPVRLAPTLSNGRVFVGSDDGRVYCLDAAEGSLIWKYRAGPADRRLPGNGRMISLWPVRSGVVVDGQTAYFCAGLFPSQGTFLCAINAADGKEIWKQEVDISAQGYLLASPSRLFLPTGRTPPHIYSRDSGEQLASFTGSGQQRSGTPEGGGCFGVLLDDTLVHMAGEKGGLQLISAENREKIVTASGIRLVAKGAVTFILDHDRLAAIDRSHYVEIARLQQKKEKTAADEKRIAELGGSKRAYLKWEVPCSSPYELIVAGDTLFAGGDNQVVAYSADDGRRIWAGNVDGKAYALAVGNGRLYAGTDRGTIHCFAKNAAQAAASPSRQEPPAKPDEFSSVCRRAAEEALAAAKTDRGYCLVLGAGSGRLARDIAKRSRFRVIGVEPDAEKVAAARKMLTDAGLYGNRVVIHHGPIDKLPYQKRFANLIVSEESIHTGKLPPAAEVYRLLRPSGGVVAIAAPEDARSAESMRNWAAKDLAGWTVEKRPGGLLMGRAVRGALEGAGEWTHFYGDAGNSACSQDSLRPGPVDIQWFGRPGPRKMVDRHEKNVGPLYKDGRLFISGDNYIVALDAYNGTILWEHTLADSIRLGAFKNCGSMAVSDDLLYVAAGGRCAVFDVQSGALKKAFSMPDSSPDDGREWGYVASVDDVLLGSITKPGATFRVQDVPTQDLIWRDNRPVVTSDSLFAADRRSGRILWTFEPAEGTIINPTIAAAGGRVYCIHGKNPQTRQVADGRIALDMLLDAGAVLVALDIRSGEVLWQKPVDLSRLEHIIFLNYAKETLVVTGTRNVELPGADKPRVRYDLWAWDAASGDQLWQSTETPVPDHILEGPHGEQVQHSAIVGDVIYNTGIAVKLRTGEPADVWRWGKSDKCGTISASAECMFSRFSVPRMFDLASGEYTELTSVTRPGCWINIIPAGGMVLIPEASAGCTCYYSIQTSLALTPRDGKP